MAATTLTTFNSMLKEFYGMALQETLNNEVNMLKYIEKSPRRWDGLRINYPVHTSRNTGVGARGEAAAIPSAGYQGIESVYVTSAYVYGRIDLTGQSMKAAGKNAFATALATEMEGIKTDMVFDMGRQSYGEGLGVLGRSYSTNGATAIQLTNHFGTPGLPGARFVKSGQSIDYGSAGDPDALTPNGGASQVLVNSVTIAQNSGTVYDVVSTSGTSALTTDSFVFSYCAGGAGLEIKGLRAIVDDQTATNAYGFTGGYYNNDTIFNVDRGSVAGWNSIVSQNSGAERILDSYLLQRTMSQIKRAGSKDIDIMFGEYEVVDAFWDSVAGDRRFASKNFDAGVDTLTFNGKTMVKDLQAPYNEMFLVSKEALKWYELCPLEFADEDGVLKNVAGYDRFEAFLRWFVQLAPGEYGAPNCCGVIRDVKVNL